MGDCCVACGEVAEGKPLYKKLGSSDCQIDVFSALHEMQLLSLPLEAKTAHYICWDCDEIIAEEYSNFLKMEADRKAKEEKVRQEDEIQNERLKKKLKQAFKKAHEEKVKFCSPKPISNKELLKEKKDEEEKYHATHCFLCDSSFEMPDTRRYQRYTLKKKIDEHYDIATALANLGVHKEALENDKSKKFICCQCYNKVRRSFKSLLRGGNEKLDVPLHLQPPKTQDVFRRPTAEEHAAEIAKLIPPSLASVYKVVTKDEPKKKIHQNVSSRLNGKSKKKKNRFFKSPAEMLNGDNSCDEDYNPLEDNEFLGDHKLISNRKKLKKNTKSLSNGKSSKSKNHFTPDRHSNKVKLPLKSTITNNISPKTPTIRTFLPKGKKKYTSDLHSDPSSNVLEFGICNVCGLSYNSRPKDFWYLLDDKMPTIEGLTIYNALQILETELADVDNSVRDRGYVCKPCYSRVCNGFRSQILQQIAEKKGIEVDELEIPNLKIEMLDKKEKKIKSNSITTDNSKPELNLSMNKDKKLTKKFKLSKDHSPKKNSEKPLENNKKLLKKKNEKILSRICFKRLKKSMPPPQDLALVSLINKSQHLRYKGKLVVLHSVDVNLVNFDELLPNPSYSRVKLDYLKNVYLYTNYLRNSIIQGNNHCKFCLDDMKSNIRTPSLWLDDPILPPNLMVPLKWAKLSLGCVPPEVKNRIAKENGKVCHKCYEKLKKEFKEFVLTKVCQQLDGGKDNMHLYKVTFDAVTMNVVADPIELSDETEVNIEKIEPREPVKCINNNTKGECNNSNSAQERLEKKKSTTPQKKIFENTDTNQKILTLNKMDERTTSVSSSDDEINNDSVMDDLELSEGSDLEEDESNKMDPMNLSDRTKDNSSGKFNIDELATETCHTDKGNENCPTDLKKNCQEIDAMNKALISERESEDSKDGTVQKDESSKIICEKDDNVSKHISEETNENSNDHEKNDNNFNVSEKLDEGSNNISEKMIENESEDSKDGTVQKDESSKILCEKDSVSKHIFEKTNGNSNDHEKNFNFNVSEKLDEGSNNISEKMIENESEDSKDGTVQKDESSKIVCEKDDNVSKHISEETNENSNDHEKNNNNFNVSEKLDEGSNNISEKMIENPDVFEKMNEDSDVFEKMNEDLKDGSEKMDDVSRNASEKMNEISKVVSEEIDEGSENVEKILDLNKEEESDGESPIRDVVENIISLLEKKSNEETVNCKTQIRDRMILKKLSGEYSEFNVSVENASEKSSQQENTLVSKSENCKGLVSQVEKCGDTASENNPPERNDSIKCKQSDNSSLEEGKIKMFKNGSQKIHSPKQNLKRKFILEELDSSNSGFSSLTDTKSNRHNDDSLSLLHMDDIEGDSILEESPMHPDNIAPFAPRKKAKIAPRTEEDIQEISSTSNEDTLSKSLNVVWETLQGISLDDLVSEDMNQPLNLSSFTTGLLIALNDYRIHIGATLGELRKWMDCLRPIKFKQKRLILNEEKLSLYISEVHDEMKTNPSFINSILPEHLFDVPIPKEKPCFLKDFIEENYNTPEKWLEFLNPVNLDSLYDGMQNKLSIEEFNNGFLYASWRVSKFLHRDNEFVCRWLENCSWKQLKSYDKMTRACPKIHDLLQSFPDEHSQLRAPVFIKANNSSDSTSKKLNKDSHDISSESGNNSVSTEIISNSTKKTSTPVSKKPASKFNKGVSAPVSKKRASNSNKKTLAPVLISNKKASVPVMDGVSSSVSKECSSSSNLRKPVISVKSPDQLLNLPPSTKRAPKGKGGSIFKKKKSSSYETAEDYLLDDCDSDSEDSNNWQKDPLEIPPILRSEIENAHAKKVASMFNANASVLSDSQVRPVHKSFSNTSSLLPYVPPPQPFRPASSQTLARLSVRKDLRMPPLSGGSSHFMIPMVSSSVNNRTSSQQKLVPVILTPPTTSQISLVSSASTGLGGPDSELTHKVSNLEKQLLEIKEQNKKLLELNQALLNKTVINNASSNESEASTKQPQDKNGRDKFSGRRSLNRKVPVKSFQEALDY